MPAWCRAAAGVLLLLLGVRRSLSCCMIAVSANKKSLLVWEVELQSAGDCSSSNSNSSRSGTTSRAETTYDLHVTELN